MSWTWSLCHKVCLELWKPCLRVNSLTGTLLTCTDLIWFHSKHKIFDRYSNHYQPTHQPTNPPGPFKSQPTNQRFSFGPSKRSPPRPFRTCWMPSSKIGTGVLVMIFVIASNMVPDVWWFLLLWRKMGRTLERYRCSQWYLYELILLSFDKVSTKMMVVLLKIKLAWDRMDESEFCSVLWRSLVWASRKLFVLHTRSWFVHSGFPH